VWTYPDVASLPTTPDLAVIATPPDTVPSIIAELGDRGTKAAVVITAGFGEAIEQHGKELQQAMLDTLRFMSVARTRGANETRYRCQGGPPRRRRPGGIVSYRALTHV